LSQLNVAVADDVDVNGFTSKFGVTTSMLHAASKTDFPVVNWLRNNGAFFVGKLKCATPFAKADCVEFAPDVAAAAVACGSCDFAICSSMVGPAAIAAPISRDVVAFSPTESSLPHATPPFSRRRSIGFVTRRFETMDHVWDVMTGADAATVARARKMHVQFGNEEGVYVGRKADADDFAVVNDYIPGPVPPVKVGVPVKWIDKVLEKPGAGLAMLDALETRQRLRAPQKDDADDDDIDGKLDVSSAAARRATVHRFFTGTGKWVRKRLPPGVKERFFHDEPKPRRKPTVSTSLQFDPVTVGWDIRHIVDVATTIADYELYRAMSQRSLEGSGVLEQLPVDTVSSIFHGKRITDAQYDRAKLAVEAFRREFAEEMTAVDSFSVPLLCPPFQPGNLRSLALALPFSLIGCPMCSLRLPLTYPSWTYRHTRRPRSEQDSTAGTAEESGSFLSSVWSSPSVLSHCVPIGDVSVAALDEGASARRGLRITGTRERNPQLPLLVVAEPGQDSTLREVTHAMLYTD
jgi:Asp-tRNA(Asn)/Glu-tRNA(Gln) amidotransferase A subunit family amidase